MPARSQSRFWLGIVVLSVLCVLFVLLGIGVLIGAFSLRHTSGGAGTAVAIVVAVVSLGCAITCGVSVIHLEHRVRGHPPGKIAMAPPQRSGTATGAEIISARGSAIAGRATHGGRHAATGRVRFARQAYRQRVSASWRTPRRRRNAPITTSILAVVAIAASVFLAVNAVQLHSQASRSGYVQAHGLPRSATVGRVQNIRHASKSSTVYTAQIEVTLNTPVAAQTGTTVYVPRSVRYIPGQAITVLVDPAQPAYAELPGQPYILPTQWIWIAVFAVAWAGIAYLSITEALRMIRRRHAWKAMLAPAQRQADT